MLTALKHLHRRVVDWLHGKPAGTRSSHWPTVEHGHLEREPVCQVCGGKKGLNVHHKKPFHLFPKLELADGTGRFCQIKDGLGRFVNNLITLCNAKRCHITFGHGGDFKAYNPDVESDVKRAHKMILNRQYEKT
jgi:5-methylcytosine-specific restriction protein A